MKQCCLVNSHPYPQYLGCTLSSKATALKRHSEFSQVTLDWSFLIRTRRRLSRETSQVLSCTDLLLLRVEFHAPWEEVREVLLEHFCSSLSRFTPVPFLGSRSWTAPFSSCKAARIFNLPPGSYVTAWPGKWAVSLGKKKGQKHVILAVLEIEPKTWNMLSTSPPTELYTPSPYSWWFLLSIWLHLSHCQFSSLFFRQ